MLVIKRLILRYLPDKILRSVYILRYKIIIRKDKKIYRKNFINKRGIEIGGPSLIFRNILDLYKIISGLDGVNFANTTIWEGEISEGFGYKYYKNKCGYQYINDAVDLTGIDSDKYDFLISSNCLEHIANPIKALNEWKRVVKANGYILVIVPNKIANFDHNRPYTTFDHIVNDYEDNILENDMSHIEEILALHDLSLDLWAGNQDEFEMRCKENYSNRGIHHHIYNVSLIKKMFLKLQISVIHVKETSKDLFVMGVV